MNLTETGESRVNGYLFVLERSLKTFLPSDVARDAVREIESHVRERVTMTDGSPNEREELGGGYWWIPVALFCGLAIFVGTHRGARRFLTRWRKQRRPEL